MDESEFFDRDKTIRHIVFLTSGTHLSIVTPDIAQFYADKSDEDLRVLQAEKLKAAIDDADAFKKFEKRPDIVARRQEARNLLASGFEKIARAKRAAEAQAREEPFDHLLSPRPL